MLLLSILSLCLKMMLYDHGKSVSTGNSNKKKKERTEQRRGLNERLQNCKRTDGDKLKQMFPVLHDFTAARANDARHRLAVA